MVTDYTKVSAGVVLRDYTEIEYTDAETEMLIGVADTLYNVGIPLSTLKQEAQDAYNRYDAKFWKNVFDDIKALDSQVNHNNYSDLLEEYNS